MLIEEILEKKEKKKRRIFHNYHPEITSINIWRSRWPVNCDKKKYFFLSLLKFCIAFNYQGKQHTTVVLAGRES